MFSRKPHLDESDQRRIALANLAQLEQELGKIHITSTGLILESALVKKITSTISNVSHPCTVEELAVEFNVSHDAIRSSISQTPFYFEQTTVYGPKALDKIASLVPATPVLAVDFCKANNVTFKVLQQLRGSVAFVGDYVLQQSALNEQRQQLEQLFKASEPVEIPNSPILDQLVAQIPYDGRFDRSTRQFTPQSYRNAQRDLAAERVNSEGAVLASEIPFDSKKFVKRYNFVLVKDYIVSRQYIQAQTDAAKKQLDEAGIFDSSTLDIPVPLDLKAQEIVPGIYIKSNFESSLKTQFAQQAAKQGQEDAQETEVEVSSNPRKLANQLKPPTTSEIQSQLDLPAKVAKVLAQKLTVPVRDSYLDAATKVIEEKVQIAQQAVTARIAAYLEGVLTCKDSLCDSLFEEWQAYASDNDPSTSFISTLPQAQEYFHVDKETLGATVVQMNESNKAKLAKLEKPKDGATILHLAVVIYHSRLVGNTAILKCRGKQIPKILKQFDFPECFTQLKTDVTKKTDPTESIKAVKAIIATTQ